jgi:OmcA/MtrC family decaheme c-type cytochrome
MKFKLGRLGAMALAIGALAGCGGGSDGGTATTTTTTTLPPTTTTTLPSGPGNTAPVGTAVIVAAAANPAGTNTADNPAKAFGLIQDVGAAAVVVQSPPVVNFTVIDSTGKFVPGLKLANTTSSAAGLAADANCSQNNVTFAMAKLNQPSGTSPSTWQSLISRQRYAVADTKTNRGTATVPKYRYAVVEGTTDPKPTASTTITKADGTTSTGVFANPATAVTDPSARIVGILEENTAGGYYTYRFATDVSTSLLMANAVDVKNVSVGKVANNGNVVVKDGKTIHRVGAQLCYTDPGTKAKVVVNPYIDFTLGSDGIAIPVKAADGKTLAAGKKVVDKASCNECHSTLTAHGTRVDPNYCVICHNPSSIDFNTNNPIDLKLMVHRIHSGKELTKDFQVNGLVIKATDAAGKVTGTGYPQDVKNCVKCHTGTASPAGSTSGTNVTANGDNWKTVPSINACGACHDGINFATGQGLTLADANKGLTVSKFGHIGGSKTDDSQCAMCHGAAENTVYHATVFTTATTDGVTTGGQTAGQKSLPAGAAKFTYEVSSVTVAGTPKRASVVFRILKNGTAVTFNTYAAGGTVLLTGFTGGPSIYLAYAVPQDGIAAPTDFNVYVNSTIQNIWDGTNGTLTGPDASGNYTAVIGKATTNFDIPANAVMVTGLVGFGSFKQTTGLDTAAYPNGLTLPSLIVQKVATGYTARRVVVSTAKCNACHEQLGVIPNFHSGARNDATICAVCHNPNRSSSGWAADAGTFIHGIHGSSKRTVNYTWATTNYADGAMHWKNIGFPGVLKNCETCHVPDTYGFVAGASAAALPNMLLKTAAAGIFNKSTTTATKARTFDANGVQNNGGATSLCPPTAAAIAAISPYVTADNNTDYGIGYSYTTYRAAAAAKVAVAANCTATPVVTGSIAIPAIVAEAGVTREAATTSLVHSQIAGSCFSCHDTVLAANHMKQNGGSIYTVRSVAKTQAETCLLCHGAGAIAEVKAMHAK